MVSITETVSLSDLSLNMAVNITSYSVDGLRPIRKYLLSLPPKMTYGLEIKELNPLLVTCPAWPAGHSLFFYCVIPFFGSISCFAALFTLVFTVRGGAGVSGCWQHCTPVLQVYTYTPPQFPVHRALCHLKKPSSIVRIMYFWILECFKHHPAGASEWQAGESKSGSWPGNEDPVLRQETVTVLESLRMHVWQGHPQHGTVSAPLHSLHCRLQTQLHQVSSAEVLGRLCNCWPDQERQQCRVESWHKTLCESQYNQRISLLLHFLNTDQHEGKPGRWWEFCRFQPALPSLVNVQGMDIEIVDSY